MLHGGAGVILRREMPAGHEAACRLMLGEAVAAGYAALDRGGSALDAVAAAVRILEDSELFNAGHGAVLNAQGVCELDAAIMDGRALAAGAVAGLHHVRNPILLARAVMERSPHVMMIGAGAEKFARESGVRLVPNSHFRTERRKAELARARELEKTDGSDRARQGLQERMAPKGPGPARERKWGTVGCVALDREGHLAAGTSTGGLTNKRFGRVGDSPIIGSGTYANDATCAVSCTGHGEYFMREVVGHDISAQMEYRGLPLARAAAAALRKVARRGGGRRPGCD